MRIRISLVLVLLALSCSAQQSTNQELTIPAIFAEGGLTGRAPESVKWSPDGAKVSFVQRDDSGERGELWYVDVATGKPAVLVAAEKLASMEPPGEQLTEREKERRSRYSVAAYHWSPDSRHILFDARGQLWLYSLGRGSGVQLTREQEPKGDPKFSPNGALIAYIQGHDLHVRSLDGRISRRLTQGGGENLLNGEVDWVYAEELDVRSNYFWSPDGKHIAFLQMDESQVPTYPITDFLATYPPLDMQKYPKAGHPNPKVRVGVVPVAGGNVTWLALPSRSGSDFYIPRFGWLGDGLLWVQVLNRPQDQLDLYFVELATGRSRVVLSERSPAWVEITDNFQVLKSGDRFLWTSWRDGYTHVYLYRFDRAKPLSSEARLERQLTRGDFEVFKVERVEGDLLYLTANQGDARQRQLYRVRLDGSGFERISREPGTHSATFAPGARYYVDTFSALLTPPRMSVCATAGQCTMFWESRSVQGFALISPRFVDYRAEDGTILHGLLVMPPEATGKVPLLLNPYGGPSGQVVRDQWGGATFLFHQLLARQGIAVLQVDNRGMGARGRDFAAALERKFGEVELRDQLGALEQALIANPQLDRNRVGFWGWSYGGTMTLWALTRSTAFKAGVSVAPVTDWRNYDTIYTERYMGLPRDNPDAYRGSSPVSTASALSGKLLLVHGTGDDNVHFQNTVQMTEEFIRAGKQFDLMLYPGRTHGISGAAARTHLFTRIQQHLASALLGR